MTTQEFIDEWQGVPWVDRGNSKQGIDCWNVATRYFAEVKGIQLKQSIDFDNIETGFLEEVTSGNWKESERPCEGLVFMCFVGDAPTHCGVAISRTKVLHCPGSPDNPGSVAVHSIRAIQKIYGKMRFYEWQK